jgi:hypothetical protein
MYSAFRSVLFALGPETAHNVASLSARFAQQWTPFLLDSMYQYAHPALHQEILGKTFANPVGLAAGFDKNARLIPFFRKAGCGFVEVGSVSARKSKGNKKPRAFRLPEDKALINRMGLNNVGAAAREPRPGPPTWPRRTIPRSRGKPPLMISARASGSWHPMPTTWPSTFPARTRPKAKPSRIRTRSTPS